MSVTVLYASQITVQEVLETNVPAAAATGKTIVHTGYNTSKTLTSATSQPVTKCAIFEQALAAGVATIDLAALVGTNGAAVNGTGLKVQLVKFKNKAANANVMTFTVGAANGYDLAGAGFSVALQPGQEMQLDLADASPDVAAGDKEIDIAGTGEQIAEITIVLG